MRTKLSLAAPLLLVALAATHADAQSDARVAKADAEAVRVALPSIQTVDYDSHARFRVNGQPSFPILLYGVPTDDPSLAQFREAGFNTLACRPEECASLPPRGFYAAVHGASKPLDAWRSHSTALRTGCDLPLRTTRGRIETNRSPGCDIGERIAVTPLA